MQILTLTFSSPLNTSLQIGDLVYYTPTGTSGGFPTANLGSVISFGVVSAISNPLGIGNAPILVSVYYDETSGVLPPDDDDYIMFGKDKTINSSSLIGYYAEVAFVNNSNVKAELFAVGSEVAESSK